MYVNEKVVSLRIGLSLRAASPGSDANQQCETRNCKQEIEHGPNRPMRSLPGKINDEKQRANNALYQDHRCSHLVIDRASFPTKTLLRIPFRESSAALDDRALVRIGGVFARTGERPPARRRSFD